MKRTFLSIVVIISLLVPQSYSQAQPKSKSLTQYVNPFVGTDFHGHTFPGATSPFGMVQLSPDTRITGWDACSGYHYSDSTIYGFSHTHLSGTGIADYCDILVIPVTGYDYPKIDRELYKSEFSHKKESASPGYYQVYLDKWGVMAQLTAGKRVGMHRYTFKTGSKPQIIIDLTHRDEVLDSKFEIVDNHTIRGYRQSRSWAKDHIVYFYIEFSEPIIKSSLYENSKAILSFSTSKQNVILLKAGISSVSEENAKMNLLAEVKDWDFFGLRSYTDKAWNEYLGKIEITTSNTEDRKVFYTALYHTAISPNLYSDVNGDYRGLDRKVHKAAGYDQYTVFSLWDTYRALHPLFTIIEQKRTADFINSFLAIFNQSGKLPIWELSGNETNCMIGYHSISVIADALKKSIRGFDAAKALDAMIVSSNKNEYGIDLYVENGYIPSEGEHESVSKTLEYAYDDWCIAQVAKIQDRHDVYERYIRRAQYYKNVFDPATGFMRPKIKGKWLDPFSPSEVNVHFVEANSWQYSFYVPQDVENHIKLMGGDNKYTAKLDELFSTSNKTSGLALVDITGLIGQYAHGNEPSHHTAYLYSFAGKPWKTQEITRRIAKTLYSSAPDGLCGNDDCGQMSAWYVLSSMGFYSVTPGDDIYVLGSPMFPKIVINQENGKKFRIDAPASDEKNIYIQSATLNGTTYSKSYIRHSDIANGSTLNIVMGSSPNFSFASNYSDRPRSLITDSLIVINPWFEMHGSIFKDSTKVSLNSGSKDCSVWYKTDAKRDTVGFTKYVSPFTIRDNSTIRAYSEHKSGKRSFEVTAVLNKISSDVKIKILSKYNRMYNAGGDQGLIDGVRGNLNFRLGGWQGYQDTDFEAIVDLGTIKEINKVSAGFLQDARSWIWMPQYVEFAISSDGVNFSPIGKVIHDIDAKDYELKIRNLCKENLNHKARYVKVFAKNFGPIPSWHEGAGGEGFIFIDEIVVE